MRASALLALAMALAVSPGTTSAQAYGQDEPDARISEGGAALGRMIGDLFQKGPSQREVDAYNDQMRRNAEAAQAYWGAREARANAQIAEYEGAARGMLAGLWQQMGLSSDEARAVAATFVLDESQAAVNARVAREGMKGGIDAAVEAYRRYDYPMANRLMLAAWKAAGQPEKAQPDQPQEPPPSDCRACDAMVRH